MMPKPKRPRDAAQLAKLIVDIATGEAKDEPQTKHAAVRSAAGRSGAAARFKVLSAKEREDIARLAAQARWKKSR